MLLLFFLIVFPSSLYLSALQPLGTSGLLAGHGSADVSSHVTIFFGAKKVGSRWFQMVPDGSRVIRESEPRRIEYWAPAVPWPSGDDP